MECTGIVAAAAAVVESGGAKANERGKRLQTRTLQIDNASRPGKCTDLLMDAQCTDLLLL